MMGRPDYDDSAGDYDDGGPSQVDTTGWVQHGQDPDGVEFRG